MTDSKVLLDRDGDLAIITLNDPGVLNAIGLEIAGGLIDAIDEAGQTARAILLNAKGRAFCAGANLTGGGPGGQSVTGHVDAGSGLESHVNPLMLKIRDLPIPIVSAVRGPVAGVGCSLALAADLVVASETAFFLQAFVNIGLVPDGGSTWFLSRAIGRARALEVALLGERLPAAKALEWGLINRVVADESLDSEALALAQRLASGPTLSMGLIRRNAWMAADSSFPEVLAQERSTQRVAGLTADHREGVAAFLAKRPACFTGE